MTTSLSRRIGALEGTGGRVARRVAVYGVISGPEWDQLMDPATPFDQAETILRRYGLFDILADDRAAIDIWAVSIPATGDGDTSATAITRLRYTRPADIPKKCYFDVIDHRLDAQNGG